ncbi:amidase [Halorarum halophilum]|uniref:Amidase n=1 Tax=Halorarum halophilum TaxID=2743090 RepID=A0A7D5GDG6_9EURY|nr:amidase [Halobaculum halophilum]QLG26608.1 amidase [Halobaculum halophilum]
MTEGAWDEQEEAARRFVERARSLPGDDTYPAFPPAEPVGRADPYGAFATALETPESVDGPLSDLDLATKDNVAVRGVTHRAGTGRLAWEPDHDATVVERLRVAGADLVGTTRMDPFALGVTGEGCVAGRTENPAVAGAVPGGSSSGSAAAVAGGLADAALGTDTAGSVRVPASFCDLVGVKPTFDLVPRTGVLDLAPTLDHVGVLARDVGTAARVLGALGGGDPLRPATAHTDPVRPTGTLDSELGRLRVGVPEEFVAAADPGVRATVEGTLADLAGRAGVTVERLDFPEHGDAGFVNQLHTLREFARLRAGGGQPLGNGRFPDARTALATSLSDAEVPPRVHRLAAIGEALRREGRDAYAAGWDARRRQVRRTRSCFDRVDVLAAPTTPMTAPEFGAVGGEDRHEVSVPEVVANTAPFNNTGSPAVSVPCSRADGAPVGIQFAAPRGEDALALRAALAVERLS